MFLSILCSGTKGLWMKLILQHRRILICNINSEMSHEIWLFWHVVKSLKPFQNLRLAQGRLSFQCDRMIPKSWLNIEVVMMKKPFNNLSNKIRKVHLQVTLDGIENVSVYNWDSIYVIKWKKMWIKSKDKFRRKCYTFFKVERGVPLVPVYQPSCVTFKQTERDWLKESKS